MYGILREHAGMAARNMEQGAGQMKNQRLIKWTKWVLDFMFVSGIFVIATVPFTLRLAGLYYQSELAKHYWLILVILMFSGLLGLLILRELRKMMRTVLEKNCFVNENVASLKRMGIISVVIALLYGTKIFVVPSPATFIIILTFFVAGLFSEVLACVFSEAVRYKEENDLTI